jgi:hypothetical protein
MRIKKSIQHFTGQEQHVLRLIKKELIHTMQPDLIWFLHSTASKFLVRNRPTTAPGHLLIVRTDKDAPAMFIGNPEIPAHG